MTKAERLAAKIARDKETLEKQRLALAQNEAALRDETRKETNKRRYEVGALADAAGLLGETNATLAQAFELIARLIRRGHLGWAAEQHAPDPETEAEVQALISANGTLAVDVEAENGVAESATRVSAPH